MADIGTSERDEVTTRVLVSRNALFKTIVLSARSVPGTLDVLDVRIDPAEEFHSHHSGLDVSIRLTAVDSSDTCLVAHRVATMVTSDTMKQLGLRLRNIAIGFDGDEVTA